MEEHRRIPYVIIGEAALISVKSPEDARSPDVLEAAYEVKQRHPRIRAVYAKIDTEGTLRIPRLILLVGEHIDRTWHRENNLYFRVTLGKTYFNPRLATEHLNTARLVDEIGATRVADLFSGVGGYALTIAAYSKATHILANDLNTYSIADLTASLYRNRRKLKGKKIIVMCEDTHLIPNVIGDVKFDLLILDYPQGSEEFIQDALKIASKKAHLLVYRVLHENDVEAFAEKLVDTKIEGARCKLLDLKRVLDYAPRKYVYRIHLECTKAA